MAKTLRAVIDRIEDGYAVLLLGDQGRHVDWPLEYLPEDAREGVILSIIIDTDQDATTTATDEIDSIIDRLKRRD